MIEHRQQTGDIDMKNIIKALVAAALIACTGLAYGHHFHHGPHHYHYHSYWGPGGRYFWPGFAGGLVGSMLYRPLPPPPQPIVVAPQAVVPQQVIVTQPAVVPAQPVVIVR